VQGQFFYIRTPARFEGFLALGNIKAIRLVQMRITSARLRLYGYIVRNTDSMPRVRGQVRSCESN
jgi:hypothetical protein